MYSEINHLSNRIYTLRANVTQMRNEIESNKVQIEYANNRIAELSTSLNAANSKITKLQSINQVWAKNWRIVDKTFKELRKKVTFATPVLAVAVVGR